MKPKTEKIFWMAVAVFFLFLAFWLVYPFVNIHPGDKPSGIRLGVGLTIFILYIGKWAFDIFAPQGLAKRVSGVKATALIVFNILIICFFIFLVARIASMYLQTGIDQDARNAQTDVSQ